MLLVLDFSLDLSSILLSGAHADDEFTGFFLREGVGVALLDRHWARGACDDAFNLQILWQQVSVEITSRQDLGDLLQERYLKMYMATGLFPYGKSHSTYLISHSASLRVSVTLTSPKQGVQEFYSAWLEIE